MVDNARERLERDRLITRDIEAVAALVRRCELLRRVEAAVGPLR